jgi:hypothetical protein
MLGNASNAYFKKSVDLESNVASIQNNVTENAFFKLSGASGIEVKSSIVSTIY